MLIDTTKYIYENRTYTGYENIHFTKSSHFYCPQILTFVKAEKFTPFEDGGIKDWYMSQVNTEKGSSILQKCQRIFKNFISGTYNLGESINESGKNIKISKLHEKHELNLVKSVLLHALKSLEMKFTY